MRGDDFETFKGFKGFRIWIARAVSIGGSVGFGESFVLGKYILSMSLDVSSLSKVSVARMGFSNCSSSREKTDSISSLSRKIPIFFKLLGHLNMLIFLICLGTPFVRK